MRPVRQSIKFYWQLWATIMEGLVDNQQNFTGNYWNFTGNYCLKLRKAWWTINKILLAIIG